MAFKIKTIEEVPQCKKNEKYFENLNYEYFNPENLDLLVLSGSQIQLYVRFQIKL